MKSALDPGPQTSASLTGIGLAEVGSPRSGSRFEFSSGKPAGVPGMAVMVVPGLGVQGSCGRRSAGAGRTGSVVGIQFEVAGMYTGTLISDLMETVELVEHRAKQRQIAEQEELHEIFSMQIPIVDGDYAFMGAA